jgi:hypothetical protein
LVFGWRREPSKLGYCYLLQNPALNAALSPAAVPAASPATLLRATRDPIPKRLSAAQGRGLVAPRWLPAEADPPQGVGSTARKDVRFAVSVSLVLCSRRCLSSRRCPFLRCFSWRRAALRLVLEARPSKLGCCDLFRRLCSQRRVLPAAMAAEHPAALLRARERSGLRGVVAPRRPVGGAEPPQCFASATRRNSQFAVLVSLVFSSRRCLASRRCSFLGGFSSRRVALGLVLEAQLARLLLGSAEAITTVP